MEDLECAEKQLRESQDVAAISNKSGKSQKFSSEQIKNPFHLCDDDEDEED